MRCFLFTFLFSFSTYAQINLYVQPDAPSNVSANGSLANPYNDISSTVDLVEAGGGGNVIIINGSYDMGSNSVFINTAATTSTTVTIKPQSENGVKLTFTGRKGFEFDEASSYINLQGLELYGKTDVLDYWSIVAQAFWGDDSIARNGGLAILLDGHNINIEDNYIHDWYQKGIEIRDGRYIVVKGNIIKNIAKTSLSGGHGIMRQQKGQEYFDNDVNGLYRWDINENMIFNVEQRIYSWVPKKGFIEMVIDEGKSILIDDPKDTDGNQEHMSARIKNNVVAFGSVDHIRLKSTPNLEVSHNSIYAYGANADGITDKQGDTNTPQFTNFKCHNNAAQTVVGISAIEIDKAVEQTNNTGGTPDVSGNYAMDGKIKPPSQSGLTRLTNGQLFVNPTAGNFRINPTLNLPSSTGVSTVVLDELDQKATGFNVTVSPDDFNLDHLKLTQTILDNIPGINDGISNNETVFTDFGNMAANYHTIDFDVVNGDWKIDTESPSTQEFRLNEVYYTWYESIATNYLNSSGSEYERIRWGDSEIKQDQVFQSDWLTVCQIKNDSNTLINGYDNDFTLDGDILIDFENFTPQTGDTFDLMSASSIVTNNTGDLFDRVLFEGFTPENYTLTIATNVAGDKVLRLTIEAPLDVDLFFIDQQNEIKIIPNPNNGQFKLKTNIDIDSIEVFNFLGKKIDYKNIIRVNDGYFFTAQHLTQGVYIIKTNVKNLKFIVK
ncbi:T9SS type A sorting domain-containing protein [Pseudofulvibacter geojedonensis]